MCSFLHTGQKLSGGISAVPRTRNPSSARDLLIFLKTLFCKGGEKKIIRFRQMTISQFLTISSVMMLRCIKITILRISFLIINSLPSLTKYFLISNLFLIGIRSPLEYLPSLAIFRSFWFMSAANILILNSSNAPLRASFNKIAIEYEGKLKVAKVNTDENPGLPENYGIMSIPTLILFKNGKEVERVTGFNPGLIEGLVKKWVA